MTEISSLPETFHHDRWETVVHSDFEEFLAEKFEDENIDPTTRAQLQWLLQLSEMFGTSDIEIHERIPNDPDKFTTEFVPYKKNGQLIDIFFN